MSMIRNAAQLIRIGQTTSQRTVRKDICGILGSVLKDIDPFFLVQKNFELKDDTLHIARTLNLSLSDYNNIYVVGAGKAVYRMALAVEKLLGHKITDGFINIPELPEHNTLKRIKISKARHPTPSIQGVRGTKRITQILKKAGAQDLVIGIISGGGSALMPFPAEGITLKEKIALTSLLLRTPATIHEINVVRKHLSQIKGGQFACFAYPATLVTLYISDIIGDPFDIQASGPTAPDPSTFNDTIFILKKYGIWDKAPEGIRKRLRHGAKGAIAETPKLDHQAFRKGKIHNFTIGNHRSAVEAAKRMGDKLGYHTLELTSSIQGEAREVSKVILSIAKHIQRYQAPLKKPALLIAGGETTVHVQGKGKGGRNQELVLSSVAQLQEGITIASFGTDGIDGINPSPVAGAIADVSTYDRCLGKNIDPHRYLVNNDSYHFFKKVGGHILTGYTGTNVGDLILVIVR